MRTADSLEKSLMLGKIEGRRRRGQQRMRWLDGITNAMDMSSGNLREWVRARCAAVHRVTKRRTWLSNWTTAAVITLFSVFKVTSILCSTVVMCVRAVASVMSDSLVLRPWDSPGMGCHALLQGTVQTLGLNPCLLSLALAGTFFTTSATWEAPAAKFSDYLKILLLEKVLRGDDSLSPNSPQSYASPTQPHPTFLPF